MPFDPFRAASLESMPVLHPVVVRARKYSDPTKIRDALHRIFNFKDGVSNKNIVDVLTLALSQVLGLTFGDSLFATAADGSPIDTFSGRLSRFHHAPKLAICSRDALLIRTRSWHEGLSITIPQRSMQLRRHEAPRL